MKFIDRSEELQFLENEWKRKGSSFVPIYGRRRVGKSRLITEFLKDKKHVYHLAAQESRREQVSSFKETLAEKIKDEFLSQASITGWKELFDYLKETLPEKKRFIITIDEATYIIKRNDSFPSYLQEFWDTFLKDTNMMLILCGSLVGLMKESILNHQSPLYGRRTGQIHLKPLKPVDLSHFIDEEEKIVRLYSIIGGIPKYHEIIDVKEDFFDIVDSMLEPESLFFEEGNFLLGQEFKELGNYTSIMKSISQENTELSNIANDIGMDSRKLSNYLDKLYTLGFVRKEKPITNTQKRYRGHRYYLKDNFLDFWFRFIFPNRSQIEERSLEIEDVGEKLKLFISKKFEDICRQELRTEYNKVGRWWHGEKEIDIVGLNETKNKIAFGECKWSKSEIGRKTLKDLKDKSREVRWKDDEREERFYLFSKSGFSDELRNIHKNEKKVRLHDLSFLKREKKQNS